MQKVLAREGMDQDFLLEVEAIAFMMSNPPVFMRI